METYADRTDGAPTPGAADGHAGARGPGGQIPGPSIGPLTLRNPFILAPMAGVTDLPYRRLCWEAGAGGAVSEMASAVALAHRGRQTLAMLATDRDVERPFWVQLFGKDPASLAGAVRTTVLEAGADVVDLNCACPARKVVSSGHGGALLKDPDLCCRLVEAMAGAADVPVTVKLRPGFRAEDGPMVLDLGPRLEAAGAGALILHGRYVSERFGGRADWSLVERLARAVKIPVVGSGDIQDARTAVFLLKKHNLAGVMLGRATRGRPWLFRECLGELKGLPVPPPGWEERRDAALRHARLLEQQTGPKACYRLRSILMWYTRGLPGAARLRAGICREESVDRQLEMFAEAVDEALARGADPRPGAEAGEDLAPGGFPEADGDFFPDGTET